MGAKQVDGLVVLNPKKNVRRLRELILEGYPLVILGASELPQAHTISMFDNTVPGQRATEHLLGLGHRRIAHISYGGLEYRGPTSGFGGTSGGRLQRPVFLTPSR